MRKDKQATREYQRKWQQEAMKNPEYRAKRRVQEKARYDAGKKEYFKALYLKKKEADPEFMAKQAAIQRAKRKERKDAGVLKAWDEQQREKRRAYFAANPEKAVEFAEKKRKSDCEYARHRLKTDPAFRLARILRTRLYRAIKKAHRLGEFRAFVGCTGRQLRDHLQSQFSRGMSWENYGVFWEVDHIVPISYFNLFDPEEVRRASHYLNLRPLQKFDNRSRGNNAGWQTPPLFLTI